MLATKLILSDEEKQLILNREWILTKQSIIKKVIELFNELLGDFKSKVKKYEGRLPQELLNAAPKISRGENYLSFPFVILDYPKIFSKEGVFAIRTMFWWGGFFSCTLHISNLYKGNLEEKILHHLVNKKFDGAYLCMNDDEWQHHFEKSNYQLIDELSKEEISDVIKKQPFIKIAYKFELSEWDILPKLLSNKFEEILMLIA